MLRPDEGQILKASSEEFFPELLHFKRMVEQCVFWLKVVIRAKAFIPSKSIPDLSF